MSIRPSKSSVFSSDLSTICAELDAAITSDLILDRKEAELQQLLPAGRKVWTMYGWPTSVGRMIGMCKTVVQNRICTDDSTFKYAALTLKVSGVLPFINKNGQHVEAREPQYQTLQKSLWYMSSVMGIQNEVLEDIKAISPVLWQEMVAAAEARLQTETSQHKAETEMTKDIDLSNCPF